MHYDVRIEEFFDKFYTKLSKTFTRVYSPIGEILEKVGTDYGYKYIKKTVSYNIFEYTDLIPIKWGFTEKEAKFMFNDKFQSEEQFIVADRSRMDKIVNESYLQFDEYIDKEIAKISLLGHNKYFYPERLSIEINNFVLPLINESCISPNMNSVSHILLQPIIPLAVIKK